MTYQEAIAIIEKISYKPGWAIEAVRRSDHWGMPLQIVFKTDEKEDAYGKNRPAPIISLELIHGDQLEHMDDRRLVSLIRHKLHTVECHEADEWFKFKGKRIFNPHKGESK